MKILIDARRLTENKTGVGRVIEGLLCEIVKLDHENEYLILYGYKNPVSTTINPRIKTQQVNLGINSIATNWVIPTIAKAWHADVAYFPFWFAPLAMPCPKIVTIHDLLYSRYPHYLPLVKRLIYQIYSLFSIKSATRIHTCTNFTKSELIEIYHIPENIIDVIPYSVNEILFDYPIPLSVMTLPALEGLPQNYLFYIGNHKPHKNIIRLLRSYQLASDQLESDLVLAGLNPSDFKSYQILMKELGIDKKVYLLGQISDQMAVKTMSQARFFVFPSLYEGFGIPPLEAMRCKIPVACSNIPPLLEVTGDASLTFSPQKIENMAEALLNMDQSKELREQCAQRGLERAQIFSWQKSAQMWLDAIQMVYK